MGFNFGAFAGGAATSGMNTYQLLEAIESQKKRDALIELQMQEAKLNMEDRAAIKGLGKETYGRIGQEDLTGPLTATTGIGQQQAGMLASGSGDVNFDAYDRQQQAQALRGNTEYQNRPDVQARLSAGAEAGLPTTQEQRTALAPAVGKYTEEQATKDYATRLKGIDFEKGIAAEKGLMDIKKGGFELKKLERTEKFDTQYATEQDNWNKTFTDKKMALDKELAINGPNGVIKNHGAEFEKLTGQKLKMDNKGMVILTKDGKETGRFPATEFANKLDGALKMHYTEGFAEHLASKGMFPDSKSAIEYGIKKAELGNQTTTANAAMMSAKAKADTVASENAKNFGAADYYKGFGRQPGGGSDAGKAAQAKALVESGDAKDMTAAYRILQGKDARDVVDREWSANRLEHIKRGDTPADIAKAKTAFFAENGVAPAEFAQSITSGINPKTGKPFDPKEAAGIISDYNRKYPLSAVDPEDLTWYKPAAKSGEKSTDASKTETKPAIPVVRSNPQADRNPYVDSKGRPLPRNQTPEGAPPAIVGLSKKAGQALTSSGDDSRRMYLQGKIDRKEPLSPADEQRARMLGLLD
jgi:hypothetical protein